MSRNMFGRIEVAWPVRDAALRQRVIDECLVPYLHDGKDAWLLRADGSYERVGAAGDRAAQQALMRRYADSEERSMDLILWRHAEAEEAARRRRRPGARATPKGERQAERMAEWLNQRLPHSTRILVSPARALPADGEGAGAQVQDRRRARARTRSAEALLAAAALARRQRAGAGRRPSADAGHGRRACCSAARRSRGR